MKPLRIAVVTSAYPKLSHADVIVSRWLSPLATDAQFGFCPESKIASLYIDQLPEKDPGLSIEPFSKRSADFTAELSPIGHAISHLHQVPIFSSIEKALTLGGETLAVDAVLMICEHGTFPFNEDNVRLYPRKEYFDQIIAVFEKSGRSVPLFCDKHLSYRYDWAKEMVETSERLNFPFFAGSSLPFMPGYEKFPKNSRIEEALAIYWIDPESYGYHSIEMIQTILDQNTKTQKGIRSVTSYRDQQVWDAFNTGALPSDLLEKALAVTTRKDGDPKTCEHPIAFQIEYEDGVRATHVQFENRIPGFIAATRSSGKIDAAEIMIHHEQDPFFCPHFAILCGKIEAFLKTKTPPYPIERVLLTTGAVAAVVQSLRQTGTRYQTPHLQFSYRP